MANFKELTKRIKGITNAQQITNTMQMVSAARLRKTETQFREACVYGKKIDELAGGLAEASSEVKNPLFEKREIKNICLAVVTSDRGMCGSYNANVIRAAEKFLNDYRESSCNVRLVFIGKKGYNYFKKTNFEIDKTYIDLGGKINVPVINDITDYLTQSFISGKTDEVYLLYTAYKSAMHYIPTVVKFLNIEAITKGASDTKEKIDYILEPDLERILDKLLPLYIKNKMLLSISESITSENSSRMIAMKKATDNADDLVKDITKERNRARQSAITTEILEIIAGSEAIKNKKKCKI